MPTATRTVNDIIKHAYYLIGEVSPNETVDGPQMQEGLYLLNDLLDSLAQDVDIPFIKEFTFPFVTGQGTYRFSTEIDADFDTNPPLAIVYCNVLMNDVSFPLQVVPRASLYNNVRMPSLQTIPAYVLLDRQELYTDVVFYPLPAQPYEVTLRAKFKLSYLELNDVLDEVPPAHYRFLRYALARELTSIYPSSNWNERAENEYQQLLKKAKNFNDLDLTINVDSILMHSYNRYFYNFYGLGTTL